MMVNVNGVAVLSSGTLREVMAGTGFSSVILADAIFVGSAVLTASTVTMFVDGTVAGAVKLPLVSIVPMEALPPGI